MKGLCFSNKYLRNKYKIWEDGNDPFLNFGIMLINLCKFCDTLFLKFTATHHNVLK